MKKKALITGISGQDGSYLAEYLLSLNYEVHGIIRRNSTPEHQESRIHHLEGRIHTYYGDVLDISCLIKLFTEIQPDEIYNLAAQSHVRISFDIPQLTTQINAFGAQNVLEAYRLCCPKARYYQASSSEMFGNQINKDEIQDMTTQMIPVSPYGAAKLFAYNMTKVYRQSYGLHACNGILFNHESPRRASNFVTSKIVKYAATFNTNKPKLELGNLDSSRDWGHSKDYVKAMHLILNQEKPQDIIVATGETRTVRDLCRYVFDDLLKVNYEDIVIQNEKFLRPNELKFLRGDNYEIKKLGWKPEYTFESMIKEMMSFWIEENRKKKYGTLG